MEAPADHPAAGQGTARDLRAADLRGADVGLADIAGELDAVRQLIGLVRPIQRAVDVALHTAVQIAPGDGAGQHQASSLDDRPFDLGDPSGRRHCQPIQGKRQGGHISIYRLDGRGQALGGLLHRRDPAAQPRYLAGDAAQLDVDAGG